MKELLIAVFFAGILIITSIGILDWIGLLFINSKNPLKYLLLMIIILIITILCISCKDCNKQECNHIKTNKDLIWMNNILHSKDTIVKYFEDGSRLEFYPSPYKKLKE